MPTPVIAEASLPDANIYWLSPPRRPPRDGVRRGNEKQGIEHLDTYKEVVRVLDETLNLKRSVATLPDDAPLLGGIPELDSMAVVSVIGTLEERFGVTFADDELDGSAFATVKSLVALVEAKLGA